MKKLLLLLMLIPSLAWAQPVAMYGHSLPNGEPWLRSDKSLNYWTCIMAARCDALILDATPVVDYCPEVLRTLRWLNPDIKLYGTTLSVWVHPTLHIAMWDAWGDTTGQYHSELRNTVTRLDGWLYLQSGRIGMTYTNVNLADTTVGKAIADLWVKHYAKPELLDGLFFDLYCPDPSWERIANDPPDYVRMGYATEAEYWQAYKAGHRWQTEYLRSRVPPGFVLIGNCGADMPPAFDGWMRENFPKQNGGTWATNMLGFAGLPGYLTQGTENWLTIPFTPWPTAMNATGLRWARYGLASACMGDGYFAPVGTEWDAYRGFAPWWLEEYAVDGCGRASGSVNDKHWLGAPLGPMAEVGAVRVRRFEHGAVALNTATYSVPYTLPRGYRFIFGETGWNNGRVARGTITLQPNDAVFLWRENMEGGTQ